jgi:hypothetical protein
MVLYIGGLDSSRLPQSKYVIVLHSDLLSRVVHFDGPPFFWLHNKKLSAGKISDRVSMRQFVKNDINDCIS